MTYLGKIKKTKNLHRILFRIPNECEESGKACALYWFAIANGGILNSNPRA